MTINPQFIAYILSTAVKLSGLAPLPQEGAPEFVAKPIKILREEACHSEIPNCERAMAYYDINNNQIIFPDHFNLDSYIHCSFLVHESVHALQAAKYGKKMYDSCAALVQTENLAYDVQNRYLFENGEFAKFANPIRFMKCPSE